MHLITAGGLQGQIQCVRHILHAHGRAQLPGDDVAAIIVQDRAEIEPPPADHLEIGEVGLPKLVDRRCFVLELIGGFQHDESRAGDQIMRLERAINRRFRHKIAFLIGEGHRQFAW